MRKSKFTDEQIAFALKQAELGISVKTVETHRARMMETLGIRRSSELLRFAVQRALDA